MKSKSPAAVPTAHRANIEAANFLSKEYNADSETASLHMQIALIRSRFGTTDHLAAQVAALAFGGVA